MIETIAKEYNDIYKEADLETTIKSFRTISKNIIRKDEMTVIFTKLQDKTFEKLKDNPELLTDLSFMRKCYLDNGKNIHLIKAFGKGMKAFRDILKELIYLHSPKTLTWFRDDMINLHHVSTKRRILCLG